MDLAVKFHQNAKELHGPHQRLRLFGIEPFDGECQRGRLKLGVIWPGSAKQAGKACFTSPEFSTAWVME